MDRRHRIRGEIVKKYIKLLSGGAKLTIKEVSVLLDVNYYTAKNMIYYISTYHKGIIQKEFNGFQDVYFIDQKVVAEVLDD